MSLDPAAHMPPMTRIVRNLERDGKPAKAVIASCVYDTDAADLWNALTDPKRIPRWFLPVSGDLKLGGRYQFEGNAGGTITECVPHKKIAATWEFGGGVSWVTVTLTPERSGTRFELEHVAEVGAHWDKFGPGAVGIGWEEPYEMVDLMSGKVRRERGADVPVDLDPGGEPFRIFTVRRAG